LGTEPLTHAILVCLGVCPHDMFTVSIRLFHILLYKSLHYFVSLLTAMLLRPGVNPVLATQDLMKAGHGG